MERRRGPGRDGGGPRARRPDDPRRPRRDERRAGPRRHRRPAVRRPRRGRRRHRLRDVRPHAVPRRRRQLLLGPAGRGHAHRPVRRRLGGHDGRDGAHRARRRAPVARPGGRPVRVAMSADRDAFMARFLAALQDRRPAVATRSRSPGRWRSAGTAPRARSSTGRTTAGLVEVTLVNTTQRDVALLMGGAARAEDLGRRRDVRPARRSLGPQPQGSRTGSSRCRWT